MSILKSKLLSLNTSLPFMEGRNKGDLKEILNTEIKVNAYGFLKDENGDYVVFTIEGNDNVFFFGGQVITHKFKAIEELFNSIEIEQLLTEGISIILKERKSKNGRTYTELEFI